MKKIDIPCIIFAGGKSSRMGKDKALLPYGGYDTLSEYQLKKYEQIFDSVYISCRSKDKFDFNANFIEDIKSDLYSPLVAFVSIYEQINSDRFFVISVDTPMLSQNDVQRLLNESADVSVAISNDMMHPLCAVYSRNIQDKFINAFQNDHHKLQQIVKSVEYIEVKISEEHLLNINYPEEYTKALKLLEYNTI